MKNLQLQNQIKEEVTTGGQLRFPFFDFHLRTLCIVHGTPNAVCL
jgi:hypothetical protein